MILESDVPKSPKSEQVVLSLGESISFAFAKLRFLLDMALALPFLFGSAILFVLQLS